MLYVNMSQTLVIVQCSTVAGRRGGGYSIFILWVLVMEGIVIAVHTVHPAATQPINA